MNRSVVATLVACTTLALATTSFAQSDGPPPSASDAIEMQLIDQTFDLEPGGNIDLTYRLVGDIATAADLRPPTTTTTTAPPDDTVPPVSPPLTVDSAAAPPASEPATTPTPTTVPPQPASIVARVINYVPLEDSDDVEGIVGASPRVNQLDQLADSRVIDGVDLLDLRSSIVVNEDGTATLTMTVPTDVDPSIEENLKFVESGIHPIVVQLLVGDVVVASHGTVIERRSTGSAPPPPISLSLLASIASPGPTASPALINERADQLIATADIAAMIDAPFALDVPAAVATAAAATVGVSAQLTQQLGDDQLLSSPATPFDVSSATEVGRIDAFVSQLLEGEEQLRTSLPLVEVGRDVWLTTEPLSGAAAQELRDLGVRYLAIPAEVYRSTVAESASADLPPRDRFIEVSLPNDSAMPVLIIDDELGAAFTSQATDEILAERTATEWSIETIAKLRLDQFGAPPTERRDMRSHLIATPDLSAPDARLLVELERVASTTSTFEFVPARLLTSLTSTQRLDAPGIGLPTRAGPSLTARLDRIALTKVGLEGAASMLPTGDTRPTEWRTALDSLISTSFDDDDVDVVLERLRAEASAITSAVVPPAPFTFTLTGRKDDIEVRIKNTLSEPLDVILRLSSPRLSFPNGDQRVTLAPNDVTAVSVAVQARSNGTSPVTVEVFTPFDVTLTDPVPLTAPVTLTARVTALTGIAQVLTGAFVLMLLTWWFSQWRTRRRARADGEPRLT